MKKYIPSHFPANLLFAKAFLFLCFLAFASLPAFSQTTQQATVSTDKSDYPPGSTVFITGSGFAPNESVTLQVLHVGSTDNDNLTSPAHQPWTVSADANGNISATWTVPLDEDELNATLQLTAVGQTSGLTAQETFTDANPKTISVSPLSGTYGGTVTLIATLSTNGNSVVTVNFSINNVSVGSANTTKGGLTASLPVNLTGFSVGNYPITATSNGYTDFNSTFAVDKAALTIAADSKTKTYGQADPAFTVSYNGFVNGDTPASLTTQPTVTADAGYKGQAGTFTLTAAGAVDPNYTISYTTGTLTVNKAALTIAADSKTKTYGQADPAFTVTYTTLVNGDTPASLTTQPTVTADAGYKGQAGTFTLTAAGAVDPNYTISYTTGTLTVNKAALTIAADSKTKTYGQADPAFTVTYTTLVNGDTPASLTTQPTVTADAGYKGQAGTFTLTAAGAVDPNYTISYTTGTLTVNKAALTIAADSKTKTYGQADPAFTVTYTTLVNGDTPASLTTQPTVTADAGYKGQAGTFTLTAAGAVDPNYTISYTTGTLTVNKAALTIAADSKTKTYGQADPAFTVTYTTLVNGDTPASLTTQPTVTADAGYKGQAGTFTLTAAGAVDPNYTISYTTGTLTVNKAALTIAADSKTKTYGQADPAFTVTYTTLVNGDTPASLTTQPTVTADAGYKGQAGTFTLTAAGAVDPNYTISYTTGTLTVNKAALTIAADSKTKTYGQADPAFTVTYTTLVNGDTPASLTTQPTVTADAGYKGQAGTFTLTAAGAVDPNYTISYTTGTLTVNKAALTIAADSKTKTYGQADPAFTVTYTTLVNGDTPASLTTQPTVTADAGYKGQAGTFTLTAAGAVDPNYTISYTTGTLTVNKAALTIAADSKTKTYGQADPAFTVTYTTLVNGDTPASLTTQPTVTADAGYKGQAGTFTLTAAGAVDPNYTISYTTGTLTVNKAALTIAADSKTKTYGQADPAFTVTYTTLVNGDTPASLTTQPTVTADAGYKGQAGTFTLTAAGAVDPNYTISYTTGTLTVNKAALTIAADSKTKTYGQADPAFTVTYTTLVNGDTPASLTTQPTVTADAGYKGQAGTFTLTAAGAVDPNYTISYTTGTLTVNKAALTIAADSKTKTYGQADPAFTVTYTTLVNGDTPASLTTQPTVTADAGYKGQAGTFTLTAAGAVDPNYTISYTTGTLTVNKAALTIAADSKTKTYGQADPAFTVTYTTLVNGDTPASLTTQPTVTADAGYKGQAGTFTLTAAGAVDPNYTISYTTGTLTVNKAALTIAADSKTKTYGQADPAFTVTYTTLVNGDTPASLTTQPTVTADAGYKGQAGTFTLTAAGAVDPNYTISYTTGTLTVNKAALTIAADSKTKTYGQADPAFTVTYTTLVNGDTPASLTTQPTVTADAGYKGQAGTFTLTAAGAVDPNYTISYTTGTLTVNKAALTATADAKTKIYGNDNPALTISYSGFIGTENATNNLPVPLTITTTATTASGVGPYPITVSGPAPVPPSSASVDGNYALTYVPGTLTVTAAPTCASYIGTLFANTCASCGTVPDTAQVSLKVVINTPTTGNEDARTACVTFKVGSNTYPATKVSGGTMYQQVFVYYPLTINIGTASSLTTPVSWTIGGNFTTGNYCSETSTVVTVSARTSDFVTGGGFIVLNTPSNPPTNPPTTISAGQYKGDPGSKTNFGFNVKWNKSLSNIIGGGFNAIVRAGAVTYQISAPKVATLVFVPASGSNPATAAFTSTNATLTTTNANTGVVIGSQVGNLNLTVQMTDVCEPGPGANASSDLIAITLKDSKGNLYYSNDWGSAASIQQPLGGGNLQVHGDAGTLSAPICNSSSGKTTMLETPAIKNFDDQGPPLNVTVYPNPSISNFNLQLAGGSNDKLDITVTDILGHIIEVHKASPGSSLTVGDNLHTGMYLIQVRQGQTYKFYRVFKQ